MSDDKANKAPGGHLVEEFTFNGERIKVKHGDSWKGEAAVQYRKPGGETTEVVVPGPLAKKAFQHAGSLDARAEQAPSGEAILEVCRDIARTLLEKNRQYGDSALDPVRVFSDAPADEQICVRLDDKLSRIQSGQLDDDEDPVLDLVGYLVLLLVDRRDDV